MMEGGNGWGFDAEFFGGPGDGLEDEVIAEIETPPKLWWIELEEDGSVEKGKLGLKVLNIFFNRTPKQGTRVAIYELDQLPEDFDHEEDTVSYRYNETLLFEEYVGKYEP
jgi:hypothetical protein